MFFGRNLNYERKPWAWPWTITEKGLKVLCVIFQRERVVATSWLNGLQADSAWTSHPISVQVHRPEEIDDIFDTISYQKVIRKHSF